MCFLMSAAVRDSTSSRSSEAFTSSPISASVARTSAEISPWGTGFTGTDVSDGFICSYYSSRKAAPFRRLHSLFLVGTAGQSQNSHIRQVPVTLGIVQAVPHHKLVGNHKTDIVSADVGETSLLFVQQDSDLEAFRLALLQNAKQVLQG